MSLERKRNVWSEQETMHLINLIKEEDIMRLLDGKRSRNSDIYMRLVGPMSEAGYIRDVNQLRTKWKHLQQEYRKEVAARGRSGGAGHASPYFEALHEILGHRANVTFVEEGIDSGVVTGEEGDNGGPYDIASPGPSTSSVCSSPSPLPKRRKGKTDMVLKQIQEAEEKLTTRFETFNAKWKEECREQREWEERENKKFIDAQKELMAQCTDKFMESLKEVLGKRS
ncbi:uncharacterized protein LOC124154701 [Ischnura elegans]|uniref:uncharacterized protein LOC124154701 n=1 Tax=Ischnura elegans TaxID=197161 RepID=UPI001ED8950F|nr:uncharacterized protein LOC124154701 [Ischnura elegans]